MKTKKVLLEQIVFERSDFHRHGLSVYERHDQVYVTLRQGDKRYFCQRNDNEFTVLAVYLAKGAREAHIDLDELRTKGFL